MSAVDTERKACKKCDRIPNPGVEGYCCGVCRNTPPGKTSRHADLCDMLTEKKKPTLQDANLVVSGAPGRKGMYLYLEQGTTMRTLARFRSPAAAEEFLEWVRHNDGSRIYFGSQEGSQP